MNWRSNKRKECKMIILINNKKLWVMASRNFKKIKYIKAELPCNKGEICLPFLVIGWQKNSVIEGERNA